MRRKRPAPKPKPVTNVNYSLFIDSDIKEIEIHKKQLSPSYLKYHAIELLKK